MLLCLVYAPLFSSFNSSLIYVLTFSGRSTSAGTLTASSDLVVTGTTASTSVTSGSARISGGLAVSKAVYTAGAIVVKDTTESSSKVTGSVITAGGLAVAQHAFIGNGIDAEVEDAASTGIATVARFRHQSSSTSGAGIGVRVTLEAGESGMQTEIEREMFIHVDAICINIDLHIQREIYGYIYM